MKELRLVLERYPTQTYGPPYLVRFPVDTLCEMGRAGGHPMSNPVRIALVAILIVILYYLVVTLGRSVAG